jgi:hypothetical protein
MSPGNEKILEKAKNLASKCLSSMGYDRAEWVESDCDGLSSQEIFDLLLYREDDVMVVYGDWRGEKIDTYDVVLTFAENKFSRMRHLKHQTGLYVVVMAEPLD